MSHIEAAVRGSKKIEAILRENFGAEGRGLHEYLGSVEQRIPNDVVRKGRYIASVRNKVVHHEEEIFDIEEFNNTVEDVVSTLNRQLETERLQREKQERLTREAQQRLFLDAQAETSEDPSTEQEMLRKSAVNESKFLGITVFALLCLSFYLWVQLNIEKQKRIEEARKNSHFIHSLQQQLKKEQNSKSVTASRQLETKVNESITSPISKVQANDVPNIVTVKQVKSDRLMDIQRRLNELGYEAGAVDGLPGRSTTLAIQEFQERNGLNATGTLLEQELTLLKSEKAIKNSMPIKKDNSLLAEARSATDEYENAYKDIKVNFVNFVKDKTTVTLGKPDIFQSANGTYSVRVPVTWSMPEREVLTRLNRYFNGYDRKPLTFSSDRMGSENSRVLISKRIAESSTAIKPYSGRLFGELQKIEVLIEVSLGNKKSRIIIAGNARCHVGCNYSESGSDSWIIQSNGKPGARNLNWKQESPIIIEGLTENDLKNAGLPVAVVRYLIR